MHVPFLCVLHDAMRYGTVRYGYAGAQPVRLRDCVADDGSADAQARDTGGLPVDTGVAVCELRVGGIVHG